jgi:4,5:9,10-diseco-3-hydroxy-5,9,17-trioxoandrosta-1(10),2-diene-4-oate hydrolase
MTAIEEHYRVVAGFRTHYVVAGEGAPTLLVHGVGSSLAAYQRNIEALAAISCVYAVDLPGHGLSEIADTEYSAENGGAFLCSFIDEVCGEPAALVGVSAGGLMCALAAYQRPDLVTRLVLVSSAGFGRDIDWTLRLLTLPLVGRFLKSATQEQIRGALRRSVYDAASITPELVEAVYRDWKQPGNRRAFLEALRTNVTLFGVRRWRRHLQRASVLALPVMIIWGKNDQTIPVKHAYRAAKRIAGARLHVFERCGHMPPFEQAPEFNRLVREFLS